LAAGASPLTLLGSSIFLFSDENGNQIAPAFLSGVVTVANPVPVPPALVLMLSGMVPLLFRRSLV
jgi:hypothetical protein